MAKHLTIGNGRILIGFDGNGMVKDFYYDYAGLENHIGKNMRHKLGVWVDGHFSWLADDEWNVSVDSERGTMVSSILARNEKLGLSLKIADAVHNEKNIYIREIEVINNKKDKRLVKVFTNQQFDIAGTAGGDTAYYDPSNNVVIHYKGRRVFLTNLISGADGISEYSTGLNGIEGKAGTYVDAEDGLLSKNPIEHGQVDSVIGVEFELSGNKSNTLYHWIVAAKSVSSAIKLNDYVITQKPGYLINSTRNYWKAWVHNQNFSFYGLSDKIIDLFNKSLIQIRTHVSRNGSIIASGDSDLFQFGRDTYSYMWPRDAAFSAIALARAGDFNASRRFFEFCRDVITEDGYFMHKYRPDKSIGSSWHPFVVDGREQLPIQEDETASVIFALWDHYKLSKDLEFIEDVYNDLIKRAAEFMTDYRDKKTGLPLPSYDLWEEKYGISTYSASSVYGALSVSSRFAKLLGKEKFALRYKRAAEKVKQGILKELYDEKTGLFYKHVNYEGDEVVVDKTVDISSVHGIHTFGVLAKGDPILERAMEATHKHLWIETEVGGIARHEGDNYLRKDQSMPGNPWFITTLWYVQYLVEGIEKEADLPDVVKMFTWVVERSYGAGILSEQLDPHTKEPLSAAPLVWSHAEYVITIIKYLEKLEEIGVCKACYPVND